MVNVVKFVAKKFWIFYIQRDYNRRARHARLNLDFLENACLDGMMTQSLERRKTINNI